MIGRSMTVKNIITLDHTLYLESTLVLYSNIYFPLFFLYTLANRAYSSTFFLEQLN